MADIAFQREFGCRDFGAERVCFAEAFCRDYDPVWLMVHGFIIWAIFLRDHQDLSYSQTKEGTMGRNSSGTSQKLGNYSLHGGGIRRGQGRLVYATLTTLPASAEAVEAVGSCLARGRGAWGLTVAEEDNVASRMKSEHWIALLVDCATGSTVARHGS